MYQKKCGVIFGFVDENLVEFLDEDTALNTETNQNSSDDDMPIDSFNSKRWDSLA